MMANSLRKPTLLDDWRALWMVRSRVLRGNLAFFLVIIGYDTKSRSVNNRIYLVYALAFFALWIFLVLTLLADIAARLLGNLPFGAPQQSAALAGSLALLALFVGELYQAARRSPFTFSDTDAQIVCTTPLDRRVVAMQWFLEAWLWRGLLVWAAAVVLGYALLQAQFPREMTTNDLPVFLVAGFRMFLVAVPLYLGVLGLAWAPGAWRLRGQFEPANLRWVPVILGLVLAGAVWLGGWMAALVWLAPLVFPVQAGLALAPFWAGLGAALLMALVAAAALWLAADGISLSRAAQESRDKEAIQSAMLAGRTDMAGELAHQHRLGTGRTPSRIPALAGWGALIWKTLVQSGRRVTVGEMLAWLSIFALSVIFLTAPNGGTQVWTAAAWVIFILQRALAPLRRDLSRWWVMRQLPFSSKSLVAGALTLPTLGVWLAGLLAFLLVIGLGRPVSLLFAWVYLISVPAIGLAGAADVLRQARTGRLLVGSVPDMTLLGVILGLLVVGINFGVFWLLGSLGPLTFFIAIPVGITLVRGLWSWSGSLLQKIQ